MLRGNLVNLVPLEKKHIELIRRWRNQEEIYQFMFSAEPVTDIAQDKWFEKISSDKTCAYFIIESKDSTPVGLASLNSIDYKNGRTDWGIYIGELSCSGLGYGAEAEFIILKYAFDFLRMNKICAQVYAFNKSVISMHMKFGFVKEGLLRQQIYHKGDYQDVVLMGILKDEFEKRREKLNTIFLRREE